MLSFDHSIIEIQKNHFVQQKGKGKHFSFPKLNLIYLLKKKILKQSDRFIEKIIQDYTRSNFLKLFA